MTCRRLAAIIIACAAIPAAPAHADVVLNPASVFAAGSQPMQTAQAIARARWGVDACGGQVAISWTPLAAQINATSTWTNPRSSYDDPQLNGDCRIEFNTGMTYDWGKFCTVMVHEYGHLSGKPHSPDPHDVMAAFYDAPLAECATADTQAPAATPPAASTAPVAAAAARVSTARKHVVKRGKHRKHHRGARARAAAVHLRHAI